MSLIPAPLSDAWFQGAVSVEAGPDWLRPWRLPHTLAGLFPSPDNGLMSRAGMPSGVRLRFITEATELRATFLPLPKPTLAAGHLFDLVHENEVIATGPVAEGGTEVLFTGLPAGRKVLELWLPPAAPMAVRELALNAPAVPAPDTRHRWVTYGSSLTHCVRANGGARTWPAIVARRCNLQLTCLGFGGQCHLDPMVGMVIRDLPADVITLKLGINTVSGSVNQRTFKALAIGLVRIIRERHPTTPIGLISPIAYPPREREANVVGMTMPRYRDDLRDACQRLRDAGDQQVWYFDGLELFNEALIAQYATDQCHPNGDGIEVQAGLFLQKVCATMPGFGYHGG